MDIPKLKSRYSELLSSVSRPGIPDLLRFLEGTDFFTAPASASFHLNYEGGLLQHSINVYDALHRICQNYESLREPQTPGDYLIITALLHDIAKIRAYKLTKKTRNLKPENI